MENSVDTKTIVVNQLLEKPEQFQEWLRSRNSVDNVGIAGKGYLCPLSTFLWDRGEVNVRISKGFGVLVTDDSSRHKISLPNWTIRFVEKIDEVCTPGERLQSAITKENAVKALEAVIARENE